MSQITEDYVSFETAKLLKEKGFDGYVSSFYDNEGNFNRKEADWNWNIGLRYSAPTLQFAMKWLRYHNWIISVEPKEFLHDLVVESWSYKIWADATLEVNMSETYQTYKDACEAAIKYCLENLI